jgi:nicotinate-nucleotide--dimethylbenzimidazole phosphoribosyltransferase
MKGRLPVRAVARTQTGAGKGIHLERPPKDIIEETLGNIHPPSAASDAATVAPPEMGGLGRVGEKLGRIYRGREVDSPLRKLLLIAAADHGAPSGDVSVHPQETTAGLVRDVLAGRTAISKIVANRGARALKAVVADFGVKADIAAPAGGWAELVVVGVRTGEGEAGGSVLGGTEDVTRTAAMSRETALAAIRAGMDVLKSLCSGGGIDLVGTGAVGLGGEIAACAIAAVLTGKPVAELTGGGSKRRRALASLVQEALDRPSPDPVDAVGVLAEYGGLEIGALAGACLAAAELKLPVVLGGLVSSAAAAVALDLAPAARSYFIASYSSSLPAHGALLEYLGLAPLLCLGLDADEGACAALAMGLVDAAWELAG